MKPQHIKPSRDVIRAFAIVETALQEHIETAHKGEHWTHDETCDRCRDLNARSEAFIDEGMRRYCIHGSQAFGEHCPMCDPLRR